MTNENQDLKKELHMTRQEKETIETNFETTKEQLDEVKHAAENLKKENSESIELLESKIQLQLEEIEAQDKFINCLKGQIMSECI